MANAKKNEKPESPKVTQLLIEVTAKEAIAITRAQEAVKSANQALETALNDAAVAHKDELPENNAFQFQHFNFDTAELVFLVQEEN